MEENTQPPESVETPGQETTPQVPEQKPSKKKWIVAVIALLAVLGLGIALYFTNLGEMFKGMLQLKEVSKPIAEWNFDSEKDMAYDADNKITKVADKSGNGNTAYLMDQTNGLPPQQKEGGLGGHTLLFDGKYDYMQVGDDKLDSKEFKFEEGVTFAAWVYSQDYTKCRDDHDINCSFFKVSNGSLHIRENDYTLQVTMGGEESNSDENTELKKGKWQHIAVVVNKNYEVKFYIDGKLVSSDVKTFDKVKDRLKSLEKEGKITLFNGFDGYVDEVKIFDKPLVASEIKKIMYK